uniref:Peptidase S1 domain-containing protein n=1 Tax=Clytia hemisphaerica TaxID=252671 RepID=A0A7M5VAD2_9CNID
MLRSILVLATIISAIYAQKCGVSKVPQSRVVNGVEAPQGAWPWIVSLQTRNGFHYCGGTILSPTWILTASHCVDNNPTAIAVVAGAHNIKAMEWSQQKQWAKRYIQNPNYKRSDLYADIALIELWKPLIFNDRVSRACIPGFNQYPPAGIWCYIAGWGRIQHDPRIAPDKLQQARLPILKQHDKYEHILAGFGVQGKANACQGDSGGPLMCKAASGHWIVEGASSWGYKGCHSVSGYTPLTKYLNWVKQYAPI